MRHPPGNPCPAIDKAQRPRRRRSQFRRQQRKMRAGEHNLIEPIPAWLIEQPSQFGRDIGSGHRLPRQLGLRQFDEPRRAVAQHRAIAGEFGRQPIDIGLAHRGGRAEHADDTGSGLFRRGLDRRHRADDRHIEHGAGMAERDGRGRIAGNHHQRRPQPLGQPPEQRAGACRHLHLGLGAIGKTGVVGGIDHRQPRQQCTDRREHRQAADAGIKDKNGRRHGRAVARHQCGAKPPGTWLIHSVTWGDWNYALSQTPQQGA